MTNISDMEPQIVMYVFLLRLRRNSPQEMDLNINDVYTVTQILERANKFML